MPETPTRTTARARKPGKPKPPAVSAKWRELFALLPGYDPIKTAAEGQWFCEEEAERAVRFFHTELTHVEGILAGQPFLLERWQQAIIGCLFGWLNADGSRRYRTLFLYVPRKNGKTPFCAGIALYVLFCMGEVGAEIPLAAASADQATKLFTQAAGMVGNSSALTARGKVYRGMGQRSITCDALRSAMKVIAADADTQHGGTGYAAFVDELHALKKPDLIHVIQTSMVSKNRKNKLLVFITTADYDRPSICNETYGYAGQVRDGKFDDARFLPVIYETGDKEDWTDEAVWHKANPNMGISVDLDDLRKDFTYALRVPSYQNEFRRLYLNQRTEQADRWLPMDKWALGGSDSPKAWRTAALQRHYGKPCIGALDLGATRDLTALVLAFGSFADGFDLIPWFWLPRASVEYMKPAVRNLYAGWLQSKWITGTDGDVMDYHLVRKDIGAIGTAHHFTELELDKTFQGQSLCNDLQVDGFNVVPFSQSMAAMSGPCKEFEELVVAGKIRHGGNPVLNWMASNAAVLRKDGDMMKVTKPAHGSMLKVDGIVCSVMCIGGYQRKREELRVSVYAKGKVGV